MLDAQAAITAQADAAKFWKSKEDELKAQADAIYAANETPAEKLQKEINRVNDLVKNGVLDQGAATEFIMNIKPGKVPVDKLREEINRVNDMVKNGVLDQGAATEFIMNLQTDQNQKTSGPKYAGAMQRGSEEAFKAILMAPRKSPELEESKKQTILLRKLADREQKIEARKLQKAV